MKNVKLFIIRDKLYEFEENFIKKDKKKPMENLTLLWELKIMYFMIHMIYIKKFQNKYPILMHKIYWEKLMVLFKSYDSIYYFDSVKLDLNANMLLSEKHAYNIIVFRSEYFSDHMYVCKNTWFDWNKTATLSVYDFKEFCNENNKTKTPLFNIEVSKSENVLEYCENNKKISSFRYTL